MFCRKCGNSLEENAKFCPACGEKMEPLDGQTEENANGFLVSETVKTQREPMGSGDNGAVQEEQNNGNYIQSQQFVQPNYNSGTMNEIPGQVNPLGSQKKTSGKVGLIIALIILLAAVAVGAAVFVFKPFSSKDPFDRLMLANYEQWKSRQFNLHTDVSISIDENSSEIKAALKNAAMVGVRAASGDEEILNFISKILSKYKLQYNVVGDFKKSPAKLGVELKALYDNKELLDASYKLQPWELSIHSQTLLSKPIYLDIAAMIGEQIGVDLSKVDLIPYLDILFEEDEFIKAIPKSEVVKLMREELALKSKTPKLKNMGSEKIDLDGTMITADKIRLEMTYQEMTDMSNKLMKALIKDPLFKKSLLDKVDKLFKKAIDTGDYKLFGMEEAAFTQIAEEIKSGLELEYNQLAESFSSELMNTPNFMDEEVKTLLSKPIIYDYYLVGNEIKQVSTSLDINGVSLNMDIEMLDFKDTDFTIPSLAESYDFGSIMAGNVDELVHDIIVNVEKNLITGKNFDAMLTDIKVLADENLKTQDADSIKNVIDNELKPMLQNFKYMLGMY